MRSANFLSIFGAENDKELAFCMSKTRKIPADLEEAYDIIKPSFSYCGVHIIPAEYGGFLQDADYTPSLEIAKKMLAHTKLITWTLAVNKAFGKSEFEKSDIVYVVNPDYGQFAYDIKSFLDCYMFPELVFCSEDAVCYSIAKQGELYETFFGIK